MTENNGVPDDQIQYRSSHCAGCGETLPDSKIFDCELMQFWHKRCYMTSMNIKGGLVEGFGNWNGFVLGLQ